MPTTTTPFTTVTGGGSFRSANESNRSARSTLPNTGRKNTKHHIGAGSSEGPATDLSWRDTSLEARRIAAGCPVCCFTPNLQAAYGFGPKAAPSGAAGPLLSGSKRGSLPLPNGEVELKPDPKGEEAAFSFF